MPRCFTVYGYIVFFWSNENESLEPVHVHVAKRISKNSTKIWILSDGSAQLEEDSSRIPSNDLRRVMRVIEAYSDMIVAKWESYFGEKAKFRDQ